VKISKQVSFANVGTQTTFVTVTIGGVEQGRYLLAPNGSRRIKFFDVDEGPVVVSSEGGVPIITSERAAYSPDGGATWTRFAELLGLPVEQLSDTYLFPAYDNVGIDSELIFGSP